MVFLKGPKLLCEGVGIEIVRVVPLTRLARGGIVCAPTQRVNAGRGLDTTHRRSGASCPKRLLSKK